MVVIKQIIEQLKCLEFIGNIDTPIRQVIQLNQFNTRDDVLFWCSDKNIDRLDTVTHGTIICSELVLKKKIDARCNLIIVDNPRLYFGRLIETFFYNPPARKNISKTASIHPSSSIGSNCYIGNNVVIEENCVVGNDCMIGHNTVLHYGTVVKNNVKMGCNNTIGGFGYGYEKNEQGQYEPIPHVGNVIIEDDVEICNNTCIDRAAIGSTLIGKNVKISNLVHIGHGVVIGKNSLIIANAMIAGSTTIGENVWIAPSSSIMNKISIGDNCIVGLSSVVIRSVNDNVVVAGHPARELKSRLEN